jgi:hypothetical protein
MKHDEGFNAETERYEDLVAAGVIDPTKVVRSALQNAASDFVASAHNRGCHFADSGTRSEQDGVHGRHGR